MPSLVEIGTVVKSSSLAQLWQFNLLTSPNDDFVKFGSGRFSTSGKEGITAKMGLRQIFTFHFVYHTCGNS